MSSVADLSEVLEFDIPKNVFSTAWLSGMADEKYRSVMRRIEDKAVAVFFEELDACSQERAVPSIEAITAAANATTLVLKRQMLEDEVLSILNRGEVISEQDTVFLGSHANALLPTLLVPSPATAQTTIRIIPLCINAVIGAVLGFILGGWIAALALIPTESGMFVGAPLGAFLLVYLSLLIANNPKLQVYVAVTLGALSLLDIALQSLKGVIPLPFRRVKLGFIRRIVGYLFVLWCVWLLRAKKGYDKVRYRHELEVIVRQWLLASASILVLLLYRSKTSLAIDAFETSDNLRGKLIKLARITSQIVRGSETERDTLLYGLVQEFKGLGFDISDNVVDATQEFEWDMAYSDRFTTFGEIEPGNLVYVVEHPVLQNGEVVKKGLVHRRRRKSS